MEHPRAVVPDDDVPAAVLAVRDDPLEVEVLDGVVLDVHREVADLRIQGEALGHGPAHEHAVDLEPEVVVQRAGPVTLDHEARRAVARHRLGRAGRLAGLGEVPLLPVLLEAHAPPVYQDSAVPGVRGHNDGAGPAMVQGCRRARRVL